MEQTNQMLSLLTDREEQILKLIAYGLTNRGISSQLFISESTVENHIHHIYAKLGISNRAQAVAYAFQLRILAQEIILYDRI